jgi:hypothetical protein
MIPSSTGGWTRASLISFRFAFLFVILFILTLSFPHPYIPDLPGALARLFEPLVKWVGDKVFRIRQPYAHQVLSDSTGLYIHLLLLAVISAIGALGWSLLSKKQAHPFLFRFFLSAIAYYLAFHMLVYGFNKIFKWQFFLPEPNTLFTTIGDTPRDLLYWSTMGSSHSYSLFLGILELIAAILLFFRKTRLTGALFSFGILLNVVMVNFSFDISVKLFSLFLLLLSIILIIPHAGSLKDFLLEGKMASVKKIYLAIPGKRKSLYRVVKAALILFLAWSVLSTYVLSRNFNDDKASRPKFHGAYEVSQFTRNGDTLPPLITDNYRWQRVFVHRRGYLIIQGMNGRMKDYLLTVDTLEKKWEIRDERTGGREVLDYMELPNGDLSIHANLSNDIVEVLLEKIDLSKLNLMKREFNFTMD